MAVNTCLWFFMSFTTLCSSSEANIICYNFAFGRNSKQIKAWGKKDSILTNHTRHSCSRPLKVQRQPIKPIEQKNYLSPNKVFPPTLRGLRFWVLSEEGFCFGWMYQLLTVPENDIYEGDLDGRKCGKGQERGEEGGMSLECTETDQHTHTYTHSKNKQLRRCSFLKFSLSI